MRQPISLLVAESNPLFCELLTNSLQRERPEIKVVGCVSDSQGVLKAIEAKPQVTLLGANLRDGARRGLAILREVKASCPQTRVLVLLESPQRELVTEAFRRGADGVLCHDEPFRTLCKCVVALSRGQVWANTRELRYVLEDFTRSPERRDVHSDVKNLITKSEAAVVQLVLDGQSNREIAGALGLTEHTVKNYLFRVFDKLGISSRVELVLYCLNRGEPAPTENRETAAGDALEVLPRLRAAGHP